MNGWKTVQLKEVLDRIKAELTIDDSVVYRQVTVRLWNKGVVLRGEQQGIDIKTKRQYFVKAGQLLMSRIDVRNGAIGLVPETLDAAIISNDFWVYDIDQTKITPSFLAYYVTTPSFIENADRTSSGTTKRIRSEEKLFLNIEIPLPPLEEQRRIVARIEALAVRVQEALSLRERAVEEAEALSISFLSKFFDYEYPQKLPNQWNWMPFQKLLMSKSGMMTGPFGTLLQKYEFQADGVPVLGIANVQANRFVPGFTDYVSSEKAQALSSYELLPNDIVVARSGTVGRSCLVPEGLYPHPVMSSNLIRLRINPDVFIPELLCRLFNGSSLVERHKDKECRGSSRTFFNQKILFKLQIPAPSLSEQRNILTHLATVQAKVDELRRLQAETQAELAALMPSILDRAFKGEL